MKLLTLLLVSLLFVFSCSDDQSVDSGSKRSGMLRLFLTDQPVELQEVWVTITDIEVHHTGGAWENFAGSNESVDLLTLQNKKELLEAALLEAGKYTAIRFFISEGYIIDQDDTRCELKVPSGKVHIPVQFDIENGAQTNVVLDFDAEKSVHVTKTGKNEQCILRPVIHPVDVTFSSN